MFEFSSDGFANRISRKKQNLLTKSGTLLTRPKTLAKSLLTEKVIGQLGVQFIEPVNLGVNP